MSKRIFVLRNSTETPLSTRNYSFVVALLVCALLYLVDIFVLKSVPETGLAFTTNFAIPFDLMICVPFVFYVIFLRRRGITPIAVIPVIYLGGAVSTIVATPNTPSLLPILFAAALFVDVIILVREIPKLARTFRRGFLINKRESNQPIEWFLRGFGEVVPNKIAARIAAMETTMWYWLIASWQKAPESPKYSTTFSYHKECGLIALSCTVIALGLIETVVVHIAVSQVSVLAAFVLSALSLYTLVWIAANTRAAAKSPILIHEDCITVVWGAFLCVCIESSLIKKVVLSDPKLSKHEVLDMSSFARNPCWIVLHEPMETETFFGKKKNITAIKLTPDQIQEFTKRVDGIITAINKSA